MAERLKGYSAWRSAWKLRRFIDRWKTRRLPDDEAIYEAMLAWAKDDRHLETWQAHQRERLLTHRREMYRVFASRVARRYRTILLEDGITARGELALPDIDGWERPDPADGDPSDGKEQRRLSRLSAPGQLRDEIVAATGKTGAVITPERAATSTRECAWCGHDAPWDAKPSIMHTCGGCGRSWDQDANACRNLLHRHGDTSGDVPPAAPGPVDPPIVEKPLKKTRRSSRSAETRT
jgi:transposase